MNSFPKSTDFTYHPVTKSSSRNHNNNNNNIHNKSNKFRQSVGDTTPEMYKKYSKQIQSNSVDFNHNRILHQHYASKNHPHDRQHHCEGEQCSLSRQPVFQSQYTAQSLQPSASNGRLDLSFTKSIFPADYLPYSRDKRYCRPMTKHSSVDGPTMISGLNAQKSQHCLHSISAAANNNNNNEHDSDTEHTCCYDNYSYQNCETSISETETELDRYPGNVVTGTISTTITSSNMNSSKPTTTIGEQYETTSPTPQPPPPPPFSSAVNAILYSRQTPIQHRPTSDLIYSQPDSALLTPTPVFGDAYRPKRSPAQQVQCCLTFVMFGTILAVLSLVVGFSFYLAIVTNFWSRPQSIYAIGGNFKVTNGDNFTMRLLNHTSTEFFNKSSRYEALVDRILDQSPIGESILSSEIHTFRSGSLVVFFRFYALKSRLDGQLDMQSKAVINLGSIENVFVDESTILARLSKIIKTTFRQMRAQLRVTQPDIFIDSETVKINRIDLITRDAYRDRLKAKWSLKKQQSSLSQHRRRALARDPLKSSNLIQLDDDQTDDEKSVNKLDDKDANFREFDGEKESVDNDVVVDYHDNQDDDNRTSLNRPIDNRNQSNQEIINSNKIQPEMETTTTTATATSPLSPVNSDDTQTITTETTGTVSNNSNDSSLITLIDHSAISDDTTTIESVERYNGTVPDDGSHLQTTTTTTAATPSLVVNGTTKNDIELAVTTVSSNSPAVITANEYQVEGFELPSTDNVTVVIQNKTRESKKLNITDDELYGPSTSPTPEATTLKPETVPLYCKENEFQCLTSGECVPLDDVCNQIMDCSDKSDEFGCKCVDYLYREENHRHKICDGVIDCQDQSDELNCPKCNQSSSFVCTGKQNQCISNHRVCDGEEDCPNGDDEQGCISLADPDNSDKLGITFNQRGILLIRHHGIWGPLCFDNYEMEINGVSPRNDSKTNHHSPIGIEDMGQAVCRANSFDTLKSIDIKTLPGDFSDENNVPMFFSINNSLANGRDGRQPSSALWSLLFQKTDCPGKKIAKIECTNFECGIRPVIPKLRRRIVGGQSSSFGSWPWQAALYREGEFQCGAVIIDNEWVLTAAHCFHTSKAAYWTVRAGLLRRGSLLQSYHEELRRIDQIVIHPDYVDKGFLNDIALLKLDKPLQFSKFIRTICLPDSGDVVERWHSQLCTTVGWGKLYEHGRIFPDTLQEVRLPIISSDECRKRTLFLPLYKITENMFCAGYERGGRDACLGDSGGPMMCQRDDGKWLLLGITSNGDGCGRAGRPGVYTKVSNYLKWIANVTSAHYDPIAPAHCDGHRCPLGKCLRNEQICDQIINCEDSSDELHCQ